MVKLIDISKDHGQPFETEVRVLRPKFQVSVDSVPYVCCTLADSTASLLAYLWRPSERDAAKLTHGSILKVLGKGKQLAVHFHLDIVQLSDVTSSDASIKTLPASECPIDDGVSMLQEYIEAVNEPALRVFLYHLFSEPDIALLYLIVPASHRHHHSMPGGLLLHSLEVAYIVRCCSHILDSTDQSLLITAALVHDLGKVRTHAPESRGGSIVHHDSLTLELMSGPLRQLEQEWPDGAKALRYLLTWRQAEKRKTFPLMSIAGILQMADQLSAAKDVETKAFSCKDPAANYANWSGSGPVNRFWRPKKALSCGKDQGAYS